MAKLIVRQGGQEQVVELTDATVTMGRQSEQNTIALRDIKASRQHCQVEKTALGWKLVDLESSNGTSVNGQKANSVLLKNGDKIEVGAVAIMFVDESAPVAVPEPVAALAPEPAPSETAVPVLVAPAVAHAEPAAPTHREVAPAKPNYTGKIIAIAATIAILIIGKVLWNNMSFESSARNAYDSAAALKKQGKVQEAIVAYEGVIRDYGTTEVAASAKRDLEDAKSVVARWDEARKALSFAKLLACSQSDPLYVQVELSQAAQKWSDTPYAGEFQTLIDRVKADILRGSEDTFATAKQRADEACGRGIYGDALDEWKKFQVNFEGLPICDRVEPEISAIRTKASDDWKGIVAKAGDLTLDGKYADARKLYVENENRFRGTRFYAEVARKLRGVDALAAGRTAAEIAAAESKLAPHRGDLDAVAMKADELAHQRLFKKALEQVADLEKRLAELKDEALTAEYGPRASDIRDEANLFAKLVAKIHDGSMQDKKYALAPDVTGEMADATDLFMDVKFSQGFARVNWINVPAAQLFELLNRMGISGVDAYALAVLAWDNGLDRDGNVELQSYAVRAKDDQGRVFNSIARHRAMPLPSDGYVYFKEKWLTLDEHKYALLEDKRDGIATRIKSSDDDKMMEALGEMDTLLADTSLRADFVAASKQMRIDSLKDKRNQKILAVKSLPAYMNFNKLKGLKQQLNTARDEAMKTIFDLKIYPDEDHGRVGQPKVDEKVRAVKDLWDKPLAVVAKFDTNVETAINSVRKIQDLLTKYGASEVSAAGPGDAKPENGDAELESILAVINEQLSLRNVCLNSQETSTLEYNKKVWAFNEKVESDITAEERAVITLVNKYREMMGLRILEIEDHLVKAARGHSQDMEKKQYFAHENLEKKGPGERCADAGYKSSGVGENIAMGMSSPEEAHLGWYNSSGHHRNMLSPGWNQMGCGHSGVYWTEDFGVGTAQAH